MAKVCVTKEEQKAIKALKRLAKKWPRSLRLFSHVTTLVVTKEDSSGTQATITEIKGITTDGGDPNAEELNQFADIIWLDC